ncbi:1-acyl-sn-glycerol-3-phosphate acyltransferase [Streptomyces cinnamoneus]|uniref:1-acyl-sn-glycerol-3-phosphate acyltransferase n=1 Tax=Streptomyces cinnamoneus TaxID=53446 RepID=A0A2G1XIY1_STRCJ|nr:lysophospholipid acyltransferase family protein [Streptomyces cinnamoneus]PHQ51160.1 1-acyl-sn-glycerol-3-phosphate acyltransferase [Streptomyces cinnamoneus]PPT13617.1 1-acyl-sn-glycerol-3-phosphate acyltransferase [Streptomyces cinnamoneus]
MFYFLFKSVVLVPLLKWLFRPRVEGAEHLPGSGAAIIAGNHLSFSDHFMMPVMVKRRITFLAKMEYFTGRGLKGRLVAAFFRGIGGIPVDRSGRQAAQAAVDTALGVLERGDLLGIYPEGTRSHDGRLYKGKVGVAEMALRSGAPVIPCAMIGTFEAQPTGRRLPRLVPITIRFGEPLDFSRYAGMEDHRAVLRAVTDEIMYAILKLSEQEYVDTYATEARAASQAVPPNTGRTGTGGDRGDHGGRTGRPVHVRAVRPRSRQATRAA